MKCPFKLLGFGNCKSGCALRVKTAVFDSERDYIIEGFTCALATQRCTVPNAQFVPAFVSETKLIDGAERATKSAPVDCQEPIEIREY